MTDTTTTTGEQGPAMPANASENLKHAVGCPEGRVETTNHDSVTTTHCVDCGAHWPEAPTISGALSGVTPDHSDLMREAGR
ncbi:hypothetical protein N864_16535 [Intrasporangium chromatireducens Q5-1]|uniref:Uncharacterized protein n=1 Tax=Intrasporangium chromatireducens Q5-1 TaxID=584657 RepID=W9GDA7_9MICO|nr:hypothetical protein [Intrasporangium chromatireducens]EWT04020.1 hypothetical protein N864_16535 [Intrasporangium chromatireducens Q5-1]